MGLALEQARRAEALGEVPVGAVAVYRPAPCSNKVSSNKVSAVRGLRSVKHAAPQGTVESLELEEKGGIIAAAHNLVETDQDASAHAEMLLLREVSQKLASWRLGGVTVYVTLEPCPMCLGAMRLARVSKIVYAAKDPRWGAAGTKIDLSSDSSFGPVPEVIGGVLAEESEQLLKAFFKRIRQRS